MKLGRAQEHCNAFKSEVISWLDTKPYVLRKKCNGDGSRYGVVVDITTPPALDRWSLLVGDCIHNLRCALDHAVYGVAIRNSRMDRPPKAGTLQFPIADKPEKFEEERTRRLTPLSTDSQARVERTQPYNRLHHQFPPLLGLVRDLNNSDKHRLLNVTMQHVIGRKYSFITRLQREPRFYYCKTPIVHNTEITFFTLDPPQLNVEYDFEASFVISLSHKVGPSGLHTSEVGYVLDALIEDVKSVIQMQILV